MKKNYVNAELDIVEFEVKEVILTSYDFDGELDEL